MGKISLLSNWRDPLEWRCNTMLYFVEPYLQLYSSMMEWAIRWTTWRGVTWGGLLGSNGHNTYNPLIPPKWVYRCGLPGGYVKWS